MPLTLKVHPQLDEQAKRRAAEDAERTFGDAGARSGQQFSGMFSKELANKLDERALATSVSRLENRFARAGTTSAEKFNAALIAESARTGIAADKIGAELTKHMGAHGLTAGDAFITGLTSKMSMVAPQVSNALSGVSAVAKTMGLEVTAGGLAAVAGIAGVGAAAIEATKHLYDIGETFDNVSKGIEIRTGKMGSELQELTESIDRVAIHTATSIERLGAIGGQLSVALNLSGQPLEDLTAKVANFERMTGENVNIRDFGKLLRSFGEENDAPKVLDDLYNTSTHTLAPVSELIESLKRLGPAARDLGLNMGQTAGLINTFDEAGLDATAMTRGLNTAVAESVKHHVDMKTVFTDVITQMQHFIAIGDEADEKKLAEKFFGTRGAVLFIDAMKRGKISVDDLNKGLDDTGPGINKVNDDTMRWAETWTIVKNRIEDALKPLAQPVFNAFQHFLRDAVDPSARAGHSGISAPPGLTPPTNAPSLPSLLLPGGAGGPAGGAGPGILGVVPGAGSGSGGPPTGTPGPDQGGDTGGQDVLGALDAKPDKKGPRLPEAPELPYGPGYGAPPRPGETSEQYGAEQRVLEERHTVEEARARVTQLEQTNTANADDIQKAKNAVLKAQQSEQSAELALYQEQNKMLTQHVGSMKELGAKLDDDFGISKGLAGIADNLTKFLGNLMMAGPLAAMNQLIEQSGVRTLAPGAGGLIGMGAVTGAFGPGMMVGRRGIGAGAGYGPSGGYGGGGGAYATQGPFGGYPGAPAGVGGGGMPGGVGPGILHDSAGFHSQAAATNAAGLLAQMFPNLTDIGGARSDDMPYHREGRALDVHIPGGSTMGGANPEGKLEGDAIKAWALQHAQELGLEDTIWQDFWQPPGGQGNSLGRASQGATQGHYDHVHLTFKPGAIPSDGGPLQGPGATPGPPMTTDAQGGVVNAPSGWSGGGGGHAADWQAIAGPEASGNWGINSGNGYSGGLQFAPGTWSGYGGGQFAPNAFQASPDQQMTVGDRVLSTGFGGHPPQGPGAWPATSKAHPDWFGPGGGGGGGFQASPAGFGSKPAQGGPGDTPTDIGGASPAPGIGGGLPGGGSGITGTIGGAAESAIGGVAPAAGLGGGMTAVGGGAAAGAGAGAASLGIGMAIQIAMQEAQRAIQYAGAVGGIATEGLLQTFLPTGGSDLAQKSWLTRIAGGLAGARPQIPNAAGKATTKAGGAPQGGTAPLAPGGGGDSNKPGGQGETKTMTHNGDVNITAPSGDGKDIAGAYGDHLATMYGGQGPNNGR